MKSLHVLALTCALLLVSVHTLFAQQEVHQRIERYLYNNYTANKGALRENERTTRILEEHLDAYLISLSKEQQELVKEQEKEVRQYLQQIEDLRDVQQLKKVVEESRLKNFALLDKYVNSGLSIPSDALACRKLIIIKIIEFELLQQKQEKLLALLKDDSSREAFVAVLVANSEIEQQQDLKAFVQFIDKEVYNYKM